MLKHLFILVIMAILLLIKLPSAKTDDISSTNAAGISAAVSSTVINQTTNLDSCDGDPNAIKGCAGHCNRCSIPNTAIRRIVCPHACIPGCACKEGYTYDENTKKCVFPEDCS